MTTFDVEEFVHCGLQEDATAIAHPEAAAPSEAANADAAATTGAGAREGHEMGQAAASMFVNVAAEDAAAHEVVNLADVESTSQRAKAIEVEDVGPEVEPARMDVLCGRGAAVNAHEGNKRFRALCFSRKPEFEAGNHAVKRRVAIEIVRHAVNEWGTRFLKRAKDKGPWYAMDEHHAILKATQTMRDFRRPDRVAQLESQSAEGREKKRRASATPMDGIVFPEAPLEPISENPFGVHDHDILCGRGAFVNGHVGNQRLRTLATERKSLFDAGNYTEKRGLATEIISIIRSLDPPGRFLQNSQIQANEGEGKVTMEWEELTDERAIEKTCQVMRDIDREDRKYRIARREQREAQRKIRQLVNAVAQHDEVPSPDGIAAVLDVTANASEAIDEAVAAAEAIMDKALEDIDTSSDSKVPNREPAPDGQSQNHGQSVWV